MKQHNEQGETIPTSDVSVAGTRQSRPFHGLDMTFPEFIAKR